MFEDAIPEKRPVGRPRKDLTDKEWEMFLSMMRISCTQVECCSVLGMDEDTLERNIAERGEVNFSEIYKKYSGQGKTSLRRLQYSSAESGNVTMQIWLGKQWLGQTDKTDTNVAISKAPVVNLIDTGVDATLDAINGIE